MSCSNSALSGGSVGADLETMRNRFATLTVGRPVLNISVMPQSCSEVRPASVSAAGLSCRNLQVSISWHHHTKSARLIASTTGLQTCGSVWACPCCGARISETRRDEMNELLSWARAYGYKVMMLTLTARHGRDDDLSDLLDRMKDAKKRWARHRSYRRIKIRMIVWECDCYGGDRRRCARLASPFPCDRHHGW